MALHRRNFLKGSVAAAALASPMVASARVLGANDEIRAAVAGLGFRGPGHIVEMERLDGVSVVALCEPDRERLEAHAAGFRKTHGRPIKQYVDYRDVVADGGIDVVTIAAPQHWHPLMAIWACQAGKDAYVEKPTSHYIWEGRQMVRAAEKYGRIVQAGTQYRSVGCVAEMARFLQEDGLGPIRFVGFSGNKIRASLGLRSEPLPVPETVDYDLWCGPAQKVPLFRDRLHYDWNFDFNTGDGDSCNYSIHHLDVIRRLLGEGYPRRVMSFGGRFAWDDAGDVPNAQSSYYDFERAPVFYMLRNLPKAKNRDRFTLHVFCEGGVLEIPGKRGRVEEGIARDNSGKVARHFTGGQENHFENFVRAVRNRRTEELNAPILEGHVSTAVTHLANISWRVGTRMTVEDARRELDPGWRQSDVFARAFFGDLIEHVAGNGVDLSGKSITMGPWLAIEPETDRVTGHDVADRLAQGTYREPFTVPEVTA